MIVEHSWEKRVSGILIATVFTVIVCSAAFADGPTDRELQAAYCFGAGDAASKSGALTKAPEVQRLVIDQTRHFHAYLIARGYFRAKPNEQSIMTAVAQGSSDWREFYRAIMPPLAQCAKSCKQNSSDSNTIKICVYRCGSQIGSAPKATQLMACEAAAQSLA
jgi:hypothetical protein